MIEFVVLQSVKENAMGRACITHERDEKCIQYFNWKTWREKITWKT